MAATSPVEGIGVVEAMTPPARVLPPFDYLTGLASTKRICGEPLVVASGAEGVVLRSSSVYVCTKPDPCPLHPRKGERRWPIQ